jgi:hypothetical protein
LDVLENDFGEFDEAKYQGVEKPYELIFCILNIEKGEFDAELIICLLIVLKCDYGDVDEAMFHDVEWPFERFSYILGIQKSDLDEVEELMF